MNKQEYRALFDFCNNNYKTTANALSSFKKTCIWCIWSH